MKLSYLSFGMVVVSSFTVVIGGREFRLESGGVVAVDESKSIAPLFSPAKEPGKHISGRSGLSARDLFGRQACDYTCNGYCIDRSSNRCCSRGFQCYLAEVCCITGCCEPGEDCCSNGRCCPAGSICVVDNLTGERGCLKTGPTATSTPPPAPVTTTTSTRPPPTATASQYCTNADYSLCPDQRFCCPTGDRCFYNAQGRAQCWGGGEYYTYYYYYSWSYSFGILWYTTTTTYSLGAGGTSVFTITPPAPPATPPATSITVQPPVTVTAEASPSNTATEGVVPDGAAASTGFETTIGGTTSAVIPTPSPTPPTSASSEQAATPEGPEVPGASGGSRVVGVAKVWLGLLAALAAIVAVA